MFFRTESDLKMRFECIAHDSIHSRLTSESMFLCLHYFENHRVGRGGRGRYYMNVVGLND